MSAFDGGQLASAAPIIAINGGIVGFLMLMAVATGGLPFLSSNIFAGDAERSERVWPILVLYASFFGASLLSFLPIWPTWLRHKFSRFLLVLEIANRELEETRTSEWVRSRLRLGFLISSLLDCGRYGAPCR